MLSIEKRKEIFIRHFLKLNSGRKISTDLNISRSTVNKVIKDCKLSIEKLKLNNSNNLHEFIDSIVVQPKRKKRDVSRYIVTQEHIDKIRILVNKNFTPMKRKTVYQLYKEFDDRGDFSYSTFSKLVTEIKKNKL